jgi:hypothetical protein
MLQTFDESATAERLQLTVETIDLQSEIIVVDARGRFVDRAFGPRHAFELEPGIYRVKALTGTESQEKTVILTEKPHELRFGETAFASPVPLVGTTTSHEYHIAAASTESLHTHVKDGAGSSLFFLVRDWTPYGSNKQARITEKPATGLSLYALSPERRICDLADAGVTSMGNDPWSACTIDLDPGVYELRLDLPLGGTLRQSFVASPNWQTQAFIFMRGYRHAGSEKQSATEWRADLPRTSVVLSPGKGFSPNEPLLRLAELARVALATKRPTERGDENRRLLPDEMRTLLRKKCENPILGIYAGHLLLMETTVDVSLLAEVVRNLRRLVGTSHPDVEALALRADSEPRPQQFEYAPMLRRSWSLIVDASVGQPGLVGDALAARTPGELLSEGPWHIWRSSDDASLESSALSELEVALAEDLGVMKSLRQLRRGGRAMASTPTKLQLPKPASDSSGLSEESDRPGELRLEIDENRARSIARRFGLPSSQLRRVLDTLENKMAGNVDVPNLTVVLKATPRTR